MSRLISWSDNAAAAKQGKGVAGEIDEFDRIEIEKSIDGSTVAIGDFLTSSKYANYGGSIEERSEYLQKNIIRTSMNLTNPSTHRFSASYKDFVEKKKNSASRERRCLFQQSEGSRERREDENRPILRNAS